MADAREIVGQDDGAASPVVEPGSSFEPLA